MLRRIIVRDLHPAAESMMLRDLLATILTLVWKIFQGWVLGVLLFLVLVYLAVHVVIAVLT